MKRLLGMTIATILLAGCGIQSVLPSRARTACAWGEEISLYENFTVYSDSGMDSGVSQLLQAVAGVDACSVFPVGQQNDCTTCWLAVVEEVYR